MRNLKKFLALVMAMIMAFSLMLTVNAAEVKPSQNYADASGITKEFVEAVDVLTGMGVFSGDGSNFKPADSITRGEMAAIIYRLRTGDTRKTHDGLYSDYGNFVDVSANDWFAPYVGYCANGRIIKGHNGYFRPNDTVTGYEALAMMMRAIGYDANGEFTGADWSIHVATYAQQLGITDDVKATIYGGTLSGPARRDVIASMLLKAARLPQVNWTQLTGYNKYENQSLVGGGSGVTSGIENKSLGEQYFGLACDTRIILGNQATGEKWTQMGAKADTTTTFADTTDASKTRTDSVSMYAYPGETLNKTVGSNSYTATVPAGLRVNTKTGLELFGHKVTVWYDNRANSGGADDVKLTYALYDKAELAKVVKADSASALSDKSAKGKLGKSAEDAGFVVPTANEKHYNSDSFSRIGTGDDTTTLGSDTSTTTNPSTVFVLISNNSYKTVDVVIPVDCEVVEISEVNSVASTKTIELKNSTYGSSGIVKQSDVMNPEAIKLGSTVIATHVHNDTRYDNNYPVYWLDTPTKTVTGKVVAYDGNSDELTLDDGKSIKRTIIDDSKIKSGVNATYNPSVLTIGSSVPYATYEITLDMQGNWLTAKPAYDNSFIYGTYVDYSTELGTSTFTYRMIGVDMNGDVISKDFTHYQLETELTRTKLDGTKNVSAMEVPYNENVAQTGLVKRQHDGGKANVNYKGFIVNDKFVDNQKQSLRDVAGIRSMDDYAATGDTLINAKSLNLSVQAVNKSGADGTTNNEYLYFTEETKFIVVDGYGTDTLKAVVYNGIRELKGSAPSVTITTKQGDPGVDEILYTRSSYTYANSTFNSYQVDTIFIPKTSLSWDTGSSTYFIHKATTNVQDTTTGVTVAKLYTVYHGGEKSTMWIDSAGQSVINNDDYFWTIKPTADPDYKTAADGRPIYTAQNVTTAIPGVSTSSVGLDGRVNSTIVYHGTTKNNQTAMIDVGGTGTQNIPFNVADAEVVNFVTSNYTVEDLDDLNDLASLIDAQNNQKVKVAVEYLTKDSNIVSAIYVIAVN